MTKRVSARVGNGIGRSRAGTGLTPAVAGPEQNDVNARVTLWRRYEGDDWAAFNALPARIRRRLHENAYDAWSVNASMLWRRFHRRHADSERAADTLLRLIDDCEALERTAFAKAYVRLHGLELPHVDAGVSVNHRRISPRRVGYCSGQSRVGRGPDLRSRP